MKHSFILAGFTLHDARSFEGKKCKVTCRPHSLQEGTEFEGVVKPITRSTTFVGEEVIYNNSVLEIEDGLESSPV